MIAGTGRATGKQTEPVYLIVTMRHHCQCIFTLMVLQEYVVHSCTEFSTALAHVFDVLATEDAEITFAFFKLTNHLISCGCALTSSSTRRLCSPGTTDSSTEPASSCRPQKAPGGLLIDRIPQVTCCSVDRMRLTELLYWMCLHQLHQVLIVVAHSPAC